ncbi:hypothetical protein OIU78_024777 [Salix suchowensis]|nr:hypothetical protein OIU78_024777 [Salix suchowensis]
MEPKTKKLENSRFNRRYTLPLYKPDASLDQVTEPVAVPFHWEQIPGKAKDDSLETLKLPEEASVTPGISRRTLMDAVKHHKDASVTQTNPRGRVLDLVKNHNETKPRYRSVSMSKIKAYSSDDRVNKSSFSGEVANEKAGLDSNDDDDVYSDALETHQEHFSTDRQTRDFMMSRFLPAAKAMAMEPAHHASRKQPMAVESSRQITKVVHENRTPPPNKSQRFIIPHYDQDIEEKESEDECDGTQVSMSSTIDVEKLSRATSSRSYSQTVKKHFKDAANKLKQDTGGQPPKLLEVENKLSCASNRFIYARCVSPRRNEVPQSSFRGREFPGNPKEAEDLRAKRLNLYKGNSKSQELSSYNGSRRGSRPASPVVEKTLYDAEGLNFLEGESKLEKKVFGSADADSASLSDKANMMDEQSKALVCISAASDGNVNSYDEQISIENDKGKVKNSIFQTPLPPILPRTPSESWLRRTLPSISSQNPLSHSYRGTSFQSKWQDPKMSSTDTKWETIVKSSYLRQDHVRYSEELIPHASEHSKS